MLALIAVTGCCLYVIGVRADRLHAQRNDRMILSFHHAQRAMTEPVSLRGGDVRASSDARAGESGPSSGSVTAPRGLYMRHSAGYWNWRYRLAASQVRDARAKLRQQWHPTVDYALRLASAVTGVSYWQMRSVSWCESRHNPFATNGRYLGLFQLSWSPFGFSAFDPVASALSTAMTVRREGWAQWECKP